MPRLKLELSYPHDGRVEWKGRIRRLIEDLDQHLRDLGDGGEWAVSGGAREWRNEVQDERYRTASVYCEVRDVRERWSGIRDLLEEHDLLDDAVVSGSIEGRADWCRIWPER